MAKNKVPQDYPLNAEALKKKISQLRSKWDERRQFKINGVGNLSQSDLDTLLFYVKAYTEQKGQGFGPTLMTPRGAIEDVLNSYGIYETIPRF